MFSLGAYTNVTRKWLFVPRRIRCRESRAGKLPGETGRNEGKTARKLERDSERQAQTLRKPGRRELRRNNYRSKSLHELRATLAAVLPAPPVKSFIIKAKLTARPAAERKLPRGLATPRDRRATVLVNFLHGRIAPLFESSPTGTGKKRGSGEELNPSSKVSEHFNRVRRASPTIPIPPSI